MSDTEFVIVPSRENDTYVQLARTKTGRLFRKHVLNKGPLLHPMTGKVINIDDKFIETMKKNFEAGVCDIVQVPLAGPRNEHTEDPTRNIGEVVDIQESDGKVYAVIDVRDPDNAAKMGKTLLGASAMLALDYVDTKTGNKVGPTLLHTCVTNRPYVTGLENYEEIVNATADSSEDVVLLTEAPDVDEPEVEKEQVLEDDSPADAPPQQEAEEEPEAPAAEEERSEEPAPPPAATPEENEMPKTLEELLSELSTEHGIDVTALQAKAADVDAAKAEAQKAEAEKAAAEAAAKEVLETKDKELATATALSRTLSETLEQSGIIKLSNGEEITPEDVAGAVAELAQGHVKLTAMVDALREKDARTEVHQLVTEMRIPPAQEEAYVELRLSNPTMFDKLVPDEPLLPKEKESGKTPPDNKPELDLDAEIARLTAAWPGPGGRQHKASN